MDVGMVGCVLIYFGETYFLQFIIQLVDISFVYYLVAIVEV